MHPTQHRSLLLLPFVWLVSLGCQEETISYGSVQISVFIPEDPCFAGRAGGVWVVGPPSADSSVSRWLEKTNEGWRTVGDYSIPAGSNHTFTAQAFTGHGVADQNEILFEGEAQGVTVSPDQTTDVSITVRAVEKCPWVSTGSVSSVRYEHTATLLQSGKVLVVGGHANRTAELYDPATGTWSLTASMSTDRLAASATLLPDGKVLVAGGYNTSAEPFAYLATAELYDPTTGMWTATGSMREGRHDHKATLLNNGKVLVTGGSDAGGHASAEIYDPVSGSWAGAGSMAFSRDGHSATLLPNGTVLVAGREDKYSPGATAEIFNPTTGTWSATASMTAKRAFHSAVLLPNGQVLVAGGGNFLESELATAELYDPTSGTWIPTGPLSGVVRSHTATLLPNGKVLISDGTLAEIYDPATGSGTRMEPIFSLFGHTATLLPNGKVLIVGKVSFDLGVTVRPTAALFSP